MGNVKAKDAKDYIEGEGGTLEALTNNNWNVRKGTKSANIGAHKNNRWAAAQFNRVWSATGIKDPKWK